MVLITSLAIEEAAETLTEDGGRFGDTLFGGQVIEAARALLKQQTEDQGPPLPLGEFFELLNARKILILVKKRELHHV
uniref:hypothetical protein n=1 Tax=Pseudomonas aeruginosa TaxID=287 RepID=UPI00188030CF|nr:hypothetical protein [Pseudomonas aeruginosa]